MKALVYTAPNTLEYKEYSDAKPEKGEVLVKVDSVGICGSDMHGYLGHDERRPAPLILGHEVSGVIASGANQGKRVTVNPLVACGECSACKSGKDNICPKRQLLSMPPREGGFAEYICIPEANLVEVPDNFDLEKSCLVEPIACGFHGAKLAEHTIGKFKANTRALVIGGGAIGVGAAFSLMAKEVGSITIMEPNALRADYLKSKTDFTILNSAELSGDLDYDVVVDAVGYEKTRQSASAAARPGGVIIHIGLGQAMGGIDVRRLTLQEITFIGTYTYTAQDFKDTARAMFEGILGNLDWYETRPLSEGAQAFADIKNGTVAAAKIVLKP